MLKPHQQDTRKPSCYHTVGTAVVVILSGCSMCFFLLSRPEMGNLGQQQSLRATSSTTTQKPRRPLQIFPMIKELRAGWGNMELPTPLKRNATGTRALVIDVGLEKGKEFFYAIDQGFEVVGFEPSPVMFKELSQNCRIRPTCKVVDLETTPIPLQREPGHSYLINAGAGPEKGELELSLQGEAGSFVAMNINKNAPKAKVPVLRIDSVVAEDVFLLKVDTQGYDHYALSGAKALFDNHVVRQVIMEIEPYAMSKLGFKGVEQTMEMMQYDYGMMCFADRSDNKRNDCDYLGDSAKGFTEKYFDNMTVHYRGGWARCWEDFLCLNIEKEYPGPIPPLATE